MNVFGKEVPDLPESSSPTLDQGPNESESSLAPETKASNEAQFLDLDKYDKPFRFDGKEWNSKDFKSSYMMRSDYTKKTQELAQERKTVGELAKYWNNLDADLEKIRQNPQLVQQFMQVYPKNFHRFLGLTQNQVETAKQDSGVDQALMEKLAKLEQAVQSHQGAVQNWEQREHQAKVSEASQFIDSMVNKFSKKYDFADPEIVLMKAEGVLNKLIENLKEREAMGETIDWDKQASFTEAQWERLFKFVHEGNQKTYESRQQAQFEKQKQANLKGRDIAPGGGIPGQAPQKIPFKKVKEQMIADLTSGTPH